VNVAAAYRNLKAAFEKAFPGLTLLITSGTRTPAEQKKLRDAYLAGKGGLAAPVGRSNHEASGPRGPRALDIRDSGNDPGVTRFGTVRAKWLRAHAASHGFDPAGYWFSQVEPWHYEFTGKVGVPAPSTAGGASSPAKPPAQTPRRRTTMATLYHQKDSKPARYALAGDSPGTAANWLETTDYDGLAVPWAQVHGNAITLSGATWADYKRRYGTRS
jgi:hypothetical protein